MSIQHIDKKKTFSTEQIETLLNQKNLSKDGKTKNEKREEQKYM